MKRELNSIAGLMVLVIFLTACGGGGMKIIKNDILGELPSLEKAYAQKMDEKEKAIKECTDMEKSFKLSKEKDLLKDEWDAKIKESFAANPPKSLPFESMEGMGFTLNEIKVDNATRGHISLKFDITIDQDIKNEYGIVVKDVFVYFKALDADGKDIDGTATVAVVFNREEMTAGKKVEASGVWQSKGIRNMEKFAKVKVITKEEYEALSK